MAGLRGAARTPRGTGCEVGRQEQRTANLQEGNRRAPARRCTATGKHSCPLTKRTRGGSNEARPSDWTAAGALHGDRLWRWVPRVPVNQRSAACATRTLRAAPAGRCPHLTQTLTPGRFHEHRPSGNTGNPQACTPGGLVWGRLPRSAPSKPGPRGQDGSESLRQQAEGEKVPGLRTGEGAGLRGLGESGRATRRGPTGSGN